MNKPSDAAVCFVIILPNQRTWFELLSTAFKHDWVLSYQVGFGPPLVRAHDRLIASLAGVRSALEKLEVYLNHCYLDDAQRRRLADLHRRLLVRRYGPLEAEAIREASRNVLDLTVQLYSPLSAPDAVRESMRGLRALQGIGPDDPPEHRTGRFWLHLSDPRNTRLLAVDAVRAFLTDEDSQAALALTVPSAGTTLFSAWLNSWAPSAGWPVVRLEGQVSVARASRDGVGL